MLAKGIEKTGILSNYKNNIKKLIKANILMKPEEFLSINLILLCISALLGALLFGNTYYCRVQSGWYIPLYTQQKNRQKAEDFE